MMETIGRMWRTLRGNSRREQEFDKLAAIQHIEGKQLQRQIDAKVRRLERASKQLEAAAKLTHDLSEDFTK